MSRRVSVAAKLGSVPEATATFASSAGAGSAQADGWIAAEGQALAFSSKAVVKGPASVAILRDPQCQAGNLRVKVIGLRFAIVGLSPCANALALAPPVSPPFLEV